LNYRVFAQLNIGAEVFPNVDVGEIIMTDGYCFLRPLREEGQGYPAGRPFPHIHVIDFKSLLESNIQLPITHFKQLKSRSLDLKYQNGHETIHSIWMLKQHIIVVNKQGSVSIFDNS
jgi:hypothetical protein